MADGLSVKMEGLPAVIAKMEGLSFDVKRKGGRFALRRAANLVRDAAEAGARRLDDPETGQSIADNISVRFSTRTFRRTGDLMFRVGVMGGARTGRDGDKSAGSPTPHWRLLEFGTQHMAARPFMRPALAQNIQNATNEFVREYGKSIDRALRRSAKQTPSKA